MKSVNYNRLDWQEKRQVREAYITAQKGKCYHCSSCLKVEPPDFVQEKKVDWKLFPEGFLRYPVHLHHDHVTGMTIGAVHGLCNAVLWQFHGE